MTTLDDHESNEPTTPGDSARNSSFQRRRRPRCYPNPYRLAMVPEWTARASCRDHPDIDWDDPEGEELLRARQVCGDCPVRSVCMEAGIANAEPSGIWGGLTVNDRVTLQRTRTRRANAPLPPHGSSSRKIRHHCRCDVCRRAHNTRERTNHRTRRQPPTQCPTPSSSGQGDVEPPDNPHGPSQFQPDGD